MIIYHTSNPSDHELCTSFIKAIIKINKTLCFGYRIGPVLRLTIRSRHAQFGQQAMLLSPE
jgi:hypothetical protein